MTRRLLAALTLLLLAGCAAPDDGGRTAGLASDASMGSSGTTAPAPAQEAPAEPDPVTAVCTTTRTNVGTTTGYGLNVDRAVLGIDECPLEPLFDGNISWARAALVEATWTRQATQTGTDLWIESDACMPSIPPASCTQPHAMGADSPLRLELSEQELRDLEGQRALVMVAGQGVVVDLEYTLHVTLFAGPDVPAGFTGAP